MNSKQLLCVVVIALMTMTLSVMAENPDYGNSSADAESITPDGTTTQGYIDGADEDWFTFTPVANTLYRVTLNGEYNMGYKTLHVYQTDEFDVLHKTIDYSVWSNDTSARTFFIEKPDDIFIKLYYAPGGYSFHIEAIDNYAPDSYSDECATASTITVDAAPTSATLTHNPDETLEVDWFVFDTEPLHMYQINLTKSDNTDLNFQLYSEDCEYILNWSKIRTVTSWFGEQYKIHVAGNPAHIGTYYTIEVVDLGLFPDDYLNIPESAVAITPDGTVVEGEIDYDSSYHKDEDWFKFTPVANTLYRVTMTGDLNMGYKTMHVYQIDEFDNLHKTIDYSVWSNDTGVRTFFIEEPDDIYIKLFYANGGYSYYIEPVGNFPPDSYSDDCNGATTVTVDAPPTSATLTHNPNGSLEIDWFAFDTEPLHMYQINLTKSDNTDLNFQVYNDNCEYILNWSKTRTVTSWFGEQYKIYVAGNPVHLGTYYTIEVVDLGLFPDDYPNIAASAVSIPKDGTLVEGEIQYDSSYHKDEDWFTFIAGQDGDYDFSITGEVNMGYKTIRVYSEDELGVLRIKKDTSVWSDGVNNFTVNLLAGKTYVQVFYALGEYGFSVVSPEPRCGDLDHPYPAGDSTGPEGVPDCKVDMLDLAALVSNWLIDNNPEINQ